MKLLWDSLKKALSLTILCFSFFSCSKAEIKAPETKHVVVITDAFFDDFLAISYLLESPYISLDALVVSGIGFCYLDAGIRNLANYLAYVQMPYIPISSTSNTGMCHKGSVPRAWLLDEKKLFGVHLKNSPKKPKQISGSELIAERVLRADSKVTLLCITALNNVAEFLFNYPYLHGKIEKIVIMGGALSVAGNINTEFNGYLNNTAEYNIALDPCSAEVVFQTDIPKVLCPLDVTDTLPLNNQILDEYRSYLTSETGRFVKELMRNVINNYEDVKLMFWDAVAAAYLVEPGMFKTRKLNLVVDTTQGPNFGKTSVNYDGSEVEVCTEINQDLFYKSFFNSMKSK
ncbi:MAG: Pyrimidine-specific ribonucleoside hydrolase RihA [Chlamydiia bacterium]|nr:Pyrimidine-specific ribonucleoside hydrolase RihA [Chlamydiia bacterium]